MNINKHIFEANPVKLDMSRSAFDLSHGWQGTYKTGKVIPVLANSDILPGSTWSLGFDSVTRSTTPLAPVMDDAIQDTFFFFVPHKLVLSRKSMSPDVNDSNHSWEAFIGAQDNLLNMPLPSDVELPCTSFGKNDGTNELDFDRGSLADYLGYPDLNKSFGNNQWVRRTNVLEALAYYCVWNHYFRDPNTMNPMTFTIHSGQHFGGVTHPEVGFNGGAYGFTDVRGFGWEVSTMPACRFHGYFGSALPWPQRNSNTVTLPLGDMAPVIPSGSIAYGTDGLSFGSNVSAGGVSSYSYGVYSADATDQNAAWVGNSSFGQVNGTNLKADLSAATAASVNALRLAVQTQRWYEALARGGNRIDELTASMFGVTPHDATSGRPEYLGGKRTLINVQQVANTAGTNESTLSQQSIGSTGAYSLTNDGGHIFTKSFDTWGTVIGVTVIRVRDSFHQGLARRHQRFDRFDFYWPQFANLGEQILKNSEVYFDGTADDDKPFGFQESWAEYRFWPDVKTGLTRPGDNQAYWNYCNHFTSRPNLKDFLTAETQVANVDRTLQVPSTTAGFQWISDFHFNIKAVLPMPTYSIPGLVDHH